MSGFSQKIIVARPPNFAAIVAAFPLAIDDYQRGIVYSYGRELYNPSGRELPPWIIAHEAVHGSRQVDTDHTIWLHNPVDAWWQQYISDRGFRFREELLAHIAEVLTYNSTHERPDRRRYIKLAAERLASPLYGKLVKTRVALDLLKTAVVENEVRAASRAGESLEEGAAAPSL